MNFNRKLNRRLDRIVISIFTFFIVLRVILLLKTIFGYNEINYDFVRIAIKKDGIDYNGTAAVLIPLIVSILFLMLYILGRKFYAEHLNTLPQLYYYITMLFTVLSVYLGSYLDFYEKFIWWDAMLHFVSGILLGLFSIIIVSFFVRKRFGRTRTRGDILTLVIIGVLVSISVSVFWEFYEYLYDYIADGNMQTSVIIKDVENYDFSKHIRKSGRFVDPGLTDTMKDQFLAVVGSIIAGFYSYRHFYNIQLKMQGN